MENYTPTYQSDGFEILHLMQWTWAENELSVRFSFFDNNSKLKSLTIKFNWVIKFEFQDNEHKFEPQNINGDFELFDNTIPGVFISKNSDYLISFCENFVFDDPSYRNDARHFLIQSHSGGYAHIIALLDTDAEYTVKINAH